MFQKRNIIVYAVVVFYILTTIYSSDFPFFWDNLSHDSITAHWFYENGFSKLILPSEMDTGNPTLTGFYLALIWTITGKSLLISHWAFFPFIVLAIWQYYKLSKKVLPSALVPWSIVLFAIDPTFLAQGMLMSPDILLISLFLLSVNSILEGRRIVLTIAFSFLCLISLRAVMCCLTLILFDQFNLLYIEKKKLNSKLIVNYIPFLVIISSWLLYHYSETGWLISHKNSPWAENFNPTGIIDKFKNMAILIWRLIDFGRVFLWICIFIFFGKFIKKINFTDTRLKIIYGLFFCFLLIYLLPFIIYRNLVAHHYLLVLYFLTLLLFVYLLGFINSKLRKIYIILSVAFLWSGHFWVYPDGIAKGWDSSLAFIPFFELKEKMDHYIDNKKIDPDSVGTYFPNIFSGKYYNLNGIDKHYCNLSENKINEWTYVVESNVCNDFSDSALTLLRNKWILETEFRKWNVYMRLYKNRKIP